MPHGLFYQSIDKLDLSTSEPIQPAVWLLHTVCESAMGEIILEYLFGLSGLMVSSVIETQCRACQNIKSFFFFFLLFFAITGLLVFLLNSTIFDLSTHGKSIGLD